MEIRALGIDASLTGTGLVDLAGDRIVFSKKIEPKTTGVPRLLEIEDIIIKTLESVKYGMIIIEGYAHDRGNQAHRMGELGGVLRRRLHKSGVKWIEVSPSQVKKFATGKGNANKDLVLLNVYKRWGVEFTTSDEADAFVLAKIGTMLLGVDEKMTIPQQEVIEALQGKGEKKVKAKGKARGKANGEVIMK